MVGIARALSVDAKVVILDEPTAALSHHEIHELYELVNTLKSQGKAILFITHKFDEIFTLADRYTVFRDGCYVGEGFIKDTNEALLVEMMVARSIEATYPKKDVEIGETLLEVSNLCHTTEFANISFSLKKGEILGVYGLVGSGRTEVMQALFGTTDHVTGTVKMNGKDVIIHSPKEAIDNGIVYVPEERQKQGIVLELPIYQNVSLPQMERLAKHGQIDQESEMALARQYCERLQVKASCWDEKVMNLSGGNQQKVVIAKWLATNPKVIILDEPTKGIDIGSKAAVHEFMSELVDSGLSVIMVSSELPEILGMSDRILVMNEGLIVGELSRADATPEKVVSLATGGSVTC
jgi:rhamnose transport system ATP-binding protein